MSEWMSIETAPKDKLILLWDGEHTIGAWIDGEWQPCLTEQQPTHWMPLPEPPIT